MKIGIHATKNSFSERWIDYCNEREIPYKEVDCYRSDIIEQLSDCYGLMWHFHQSSTKDHIFAKQLLYSIQASGKKVFPDFNTGWHFDDKIGQKYLLEALECDLVPSYIFYDKHDALRWIDTAVFPLVFKLRGGAGSQNVKLVRNKSEAKGLVKRAFGKGFSAYSSGEVLKDRYKKYLVDKASLRDVFKALVRLIIPPKFSRMRGREVGYIYFQKFISGNDHDIRVVVIGGKAFAIKRLVRKNDFRASGSGQIFYEKSNFDDAVIEKAFSVSERIESQCTAIDFVKENGRWLVVEVSFGFAPYGYDPCIGYWDRSLKFHNGKFNPYGWMVDIFLNQFSGSVINYS